MTVPAWWVARLISPVLVLLIVAAPMLLSGFHVRLLVYVGISALVTLGLSVLTSVAGLTSFGQSAFMGLGAYATAYVTTVQGGSPWLGLLAVCCCRRWWRPGSGR